MPGASHLRRRVVPALAGAALAGAVLAGCGPTQDVSTGQAGPERAAQDQTASPAVAATEEPQPGATTDVPVAPVVRWAVPEVAGYTPSASDVPGVVQLASVSDSCLFQLADDPLPAQETSADPVEVAAEQVLGELGAQETGRTRGAIAAGEEEPIAALEVTFDAEVDGSVARGVLLVAAVTEQDALLSVTYVCSDASVPASTWQALQEGTTVAFDAQPPR